MSMMPGTWWCKQCDTWFAGPMETWPCGDREYSRQYACPLVEKSYMMYEEPKDPNRGLKLIFGFLLVIIILLGVLSCQ